MVAPTRLRGRRVLDLSALAVQQPHSLAISMASQLASSFGIEVFRPESAGDLVASMPPYRSDATSAVGHFLLRNRCSESSGPPDAAIGDYESLASSNAPLKVCISTYGSAGDAPTSEFELMARSGIMYVVRARDGAAYPLAGHQISYAAGLAAFTSLASGLYASLRETIHVSLFDVACWLNWKSCATALLSEGAVQQTPRQSDWRTIPVLDGHVALVFTDKDWPALQSMIGDARLQSPQFATQASRRQHWNELEAIMRPWFAARTRDEVTLSAQARRIPIGPVLSPGDLLRDRQFRGRGFLASDGTPRLPVLADGRAWASDRRTSFSGAIQ